MVMMMFGVWIHDGTTDPFHPHLHRCYPTGALRALHLMVSPGGAGSGGDQ